MGTRRGAIALVAVCLALAAAAAWWLTSSKDAADTPRFDPVEYQPEAWTAILVAPDATDAQTGDSATRRQAQIDALNTAPSTLEDRKDAEALAGAIVQAAVSGVGRSQWADYFPRSGDDPSGCRDVTIDAVNAQPLPYAAMGNQTWAKAIVVWNGNCPGTLDTFTPQGGLQASYVYLLRGDNGWIPVREAALPGRGSSLGGQDVDRSLLDTLDGCSRGDQYARIEVATAWKELCEAATADGIALVATSAWRSAQQQAELYDEARTLWGDDADLYIARSDTDGCTSKHCAGVAIDVELSDTTLAWLRSPVGCLTAGDVTPVAPDGTCPAGADLVSRAARYGFVQPLTSSPGHLEYAGPVSRISTGGDTCRDVAPGPVPGQIADVWRCRLARAGVTDSASVDIVATAVTVARCQSNWNPAFVAFDGTFRDEPHPDTGQPYDAAGLFALSRDYARAYTGDEQSWIDPAVAADTAASAWLEEETYGRDGWQLFSCVSGDGIVTGGLLDQGLPAWAYQY